MKNSFARILWIVVSRLKWVGQLRWQIVLYVLMKTHARLIFKTSPLIIVARRQKYFTSAKLIVICKLFRSLNCNVPLLRLNRRERWRFRVGQQVVRTRHFHFALNANEQGWIGPKSSGSSLSGREVKFAFLEGGRGRSDKCARSFRINFAARLSRPEVAD